MLFTHLPLHFLIFRLFELLKIVYDNIIYTLKTGI